MLRLAARSKMGQPERSAMPPPAMPTPQFQIPNPKTARLPDADRQSRLLAIAAAMWMALFLAWSFSLEFSSNPPLARWQLWALVPELLDFVNPPVEPAVKAAAADGALSGWQFFPQRFELIAIAGLILAGAWGAGHLLLRILRPPLPAVCLERTVFAFAVGLSALSSGTLAAGLLGLLSRPLLGSLIVLCFIAEGGLRLKQHLSHATAANGSALGAPRPMPPLSRQHWLALATLAPFLLATLLGALLPSTDFDVNEYHFEGPKEFFEAGHVSFLEHNVYTSMPFGTEMLTLLAMVLKGDWYYGALAGKCLLMMFGPLTGLALFAAGRRWFGNTAGVLSAILYLSTPWIYRISTIAYAEGGGCFYLFTALLAMMIAAEHLTSGCETSSGSGGVLPVVVAERETGAGGRKEGPGAGGFSTREEENRVSLAALAATRANVRQVALAGLLAGSAMACKYPALVSVVIPLFAWVLWKSIWYSRPIRWILPAAFLLGTALAVGPWLIKNAVETRNPVYPLAYQLFGGRDWDAALDAKWKKAHSPPTYALSSLGDLAREIGGRSNWDNPLLFALAPLALFASSRRRSAGLWLYIGWLFFSCWLFTHRIDRFWVPLLPVVALLAGSGAAWWWRRLEPGLIGVAFVHRPASFAGWWLQRFDRGLGRSALAVPLIAVGLFNLELMVGSPGLCGYNAYLRDLGEASRFAARHVAGELAGLNHTLPPGSKVLSVGDAAMFEARFPVVYNTVFDHSIFEEWFALRAGEPAAGLRDAKAIRKKLVDEEITHIYVCWREIVRYRSPGNYGYTDFVSPERFQELQRLEIIEPAWQVAEAYKPLDELDPQQRQLVETWGKSLIREKAGQAEFVTFQVFPVVGHVTPRGARSLRVR